MTIPTASFDPTQVRDLTRRGVPLHFAPGVVVIAVAVGLLLLGGAPALLGGWLLATALPIAIGALFRDPRLALVPPAVWAGWLVVTWSAPADAGLAHTPLGVALALALIGAGATLLAQRAIFPATAPDAWDAATGRRARSALRRSGPLTGGTPSPAAAALPVQVMVPADGTPAGGAPDGDELAADALTIVDDAFDAPFEAVPADSAADDADDADDADAPTRAPIHAARLTVAEVPLGADPAPLDEGGHVTEFPALRLEGDLAESGRPRR